MFFLSFIICPGGLHGGDAPEPILSTGAVWYIRACMFVHVCMPGCVCVCIQCDTLLCDSSLGVGRKDSSRVPFCFLGRQGASSSPCCLSPLLKLSSELEGRFSNLLARKKDLQEALFCRKIMAKF